MKSKKSKNKELDNKKDKVPEKSKLKPKQNEIEKLNYYETTAKNQMFKKMKIIYY